MPSPVLQKLYFNCKGYLNILFMIVLGTTNDDDDIFQCGRCKKQFYSLGSFVAHKKTHNLGKNFEVLYFG